MKMRNDAFHYTGHQDTRLPFNALVMRLQSRILFTQIAPVMKRNPQPFPAGVWVDSWAHPTVQNSSIAV